MKQTSIARVAWLMLVSTVLAACGTTPAPDFKGRWAPVNRFAPSTEAIPLYQSYIFQPSPMDGTLKNMLTRWANDSNRTLTYLHPSDFTLHAPVSSIHTNRAQQAVSQLNTIYAEQKVSIALEDSQIVVRLAESAPAAPAPTASVTSTNAAVPQDVTPSGGSLN